MSAARPQPEVLEAFYMLGTGVGVASGTNAGAGVGVADAATLSSRSGDGLYDSQPRVPIPSEPVNVMVSGVPAVVLRVWE